MAKEAGGVGREKYWTKTTCDCSRKDESKGSVYKSENETGRNESKMRTAKLIRNHVFPPTNAFAFCSNTNLILWFVSKKKYCAVPPIKVGNQKNPQFPSSNYGKQVECHENIIGVFSKPHEPCAIGQGTPYLQFSMQEARDNPREMQTSSNAFRWTLLSWTVEFESLIGQHSTFINHIYHKVTFLVVLWWSLCVTSILTSTLDQ